MGGKSKGSVSAPDMPDLPDAPGFGADTSELLRQQATSSILNTAGPFGSSTITGDPATGFTRTSELSPELQELSQRILAPSADIEQAYFDRGMNLLRPEFERSMEAEDVALAARGLPVGSELRADIENASARQRNEAMENLALSSILQGEQQRSRDVANFMNLYGTTGTAQGPQINTLAAYQLPYQAEVLPYQSEINALMTQYGADTQAAAQTAQNQAGLKGGKLGGAAQLGAAALTPAAPAPIVIGGIG